MRCISADLIVSEIAFESKHTLLNLHAESGSTHRYPDVFVLRGGPREGIKSERYRSANQRKPKIVTLAGRGEGGRSHRREGQAGSTGEL